MKNLKVPSCRYEHYMETTEDPIYTHVNGYIICYSCKNNQTVDELRAVTSMRTRALSISA